MTEERGYRPEQDELFTAKDGWLDAEITGNGLWPQIDEAIRIETAHSVVSGGLDDIRIFQRSVLSNAQLARWKKVLNNMHASHGIDIKTDYAYPHFIINDKHLNLMWRELRKDTLKTIATYVRLSAPGLVGVLPDKSDDMRVITSYLDQSAGSDNSVQLQNFFRTLHDGLHTKEAKELARRFKKNFIDFTSLDQREKDKRKIQNTRLRHSMAYRLIQDAVTAGYKQEFIEDFLFQAFDAIDPDVINLVATLPADAYFSP